jgi:hypothetical protein
MALGIRCRSSCNGSRCSLSLPSCHHPSSLSAYWIFCKCVLFESYPRIGAYISKNRPIPTGHPKNQKIGAKIISSILSLDD